MRTDRYKLNNPAFNQFVYSILYNASFETKRIVPPRFLDMIRNERKAKGFIRTATLDQVCALLAYMGIGNFHVFFDKSTTTINDFKEILKKFKDNNKFGSLKDLVDKGIFVTSDKELIALLELSAQTIHHKAYLMKLEYKRIGYHIHNWSKQYTDPQDALSQDIQEQSKLLVRTLLSCSLTLDKADFLFGLDRLDVQLLWYLYPYRHTYVSAEQVHTYFLAYKTKSTLTQALYRLQRSLFIQPSALSAKREFTITNLGIRTVEQFTDAVLHSNHFS